MPDPQSSTQEGSGVDGDRSSGGRSIELHSGGICHPRKTAEEQSNKEIVAMPAHASASSLIDASKLGRNHILTDQFVLKTKNEAAEHEPKAKFSKVRISSEPSPHHLKTSGKQRSMVVSLNANC